MTGSELRALLAVATKGPWEATQDNGYFKVCRDSGDGETHECVLSTFSLREEDSQAADAALIIFLRNNAERFAELLEREETATVKETETVPVIEWRPAKYNGEILYVGNEWVGSVYQIDYAWQANCCKGVKTDLGLFHDVHTARAAVEAAVRAGR